MTAQFGAFGKISGLGDFLRLNSPGAFVRVWDDWMQAGLLAARDALGEGWNECYLSAPIWRFSLPGGILGEKGATGVLMASVDRVGRQYPLTIAALCPAGNTALRHFANAPLLTTVEDIALGTLDDHAGRDDLARALEGLELAIPGEPEAVGSVYSGSLPPEHLLAARALSERWGEIGIWTTHVGDDHRMLLNRGLPDPHQLVGLFDLDAAMWRSGRVVQPA